MNRVVIDLESEHSAWSLPLASHKKIREAFGPGWDVRGIPFCPSTQGAVSAGVDRKADIYEGVEVYLGWGIPRSVARTALGTLKWAHSAAAGVGASITAELHLSGAVLTNSSGIHAEPVSDWVIAAIGFCARGFHDAVVAQRQGKWARESFAGPNSVLTEFSSLRVGIVGFGGIGVAVARKCSALGMEVRAVRRRVSASKPDSVAWIGGPGEIRELAANSDILVLTLPYTDATVNLIDEAVLAALPRGAFVLNVSRGGILDETALLSQLECGHIRGCVLDVFAKEPLDNEHPFWDHPGVLVTPHVSAVTQLFWEREVGLIVENVGRFLSGDLLRNIVNLEAGY